MVKAKVAPSLKYDRFGSFGHIIPRFFLVCKRCGEKLAKLCWVLIALIGVIGVLNIINTVYSNIHTRIGEIGMQRAIGMSAASLYKTFL